MTASGLLCPVCQRESSSGRFCRWCGAEFARRDEPANDRGPAAFDASHFPTGVTTPTASAPREPAQWMSANGTSPVDPRLQVTAALGSQGTIGHWPPPGWGSAPGFTQQVPPSWPVPQPQTGPPPQRPPRSPVLAVAATTAILLVMLALAAAVILLVANGDSHESKILTRPPIATTAAEGAR